MVKNRKTDAATRKQQYRGVRMRSWGSWVSEIRAPSQKTRIWLGSYSTPEAAARAYDAALLCLKGPRSDFNFAESAHIRIPNETPLSAKSIQSLAAAAAANAPEVSSSTSTTTPPASPVDSWIESADGGFRSPTCVGELMMLFDPLQPVVEDFSEDADSFNLWNFS